MKFIISTIRKANGSEIVKEHRFDDYDFRAEFNAAERNGDRIVRTRTITREVVDFD